MRVFVTGATGWIGSALVPDLIDAGHQVLGLTRSDKGAAALEAAGAEVLRGSLDDQDSLRSGATDADAVVHLAYVHDGSADPGPLDVAAITAMGEVLEGSGKPFVGTSGTLMVAGGHLATEVEPPLPNTPRTAGELTASGLADRGIRASVVRLAPTVHGRGDHGFVHQLVQIARDKGVSGYVGDGGNHWPAVHRLDAARLFRLAVESAPAGARLHGAAEPGVPFLDIATAIGRGLGVPVASIAPDRATDHFGWLGAVAALDNRASAAITRKLLNWDPVQPGLIADLGGGHYFA